ncbi:alpha/beta fold hydrolase [Nocardia sp. GCM10030253]|uniref:alpha/beta fold hydrolase n=1 Tax=Nocardia sp. GCM10030253 TaxID=3273404 RepID=UPI0036423D22
MSVTDHEIFELGDFAFAGGTVPDARLVYRTYGELADDKSNAILFPTWFAGTHIHNEWLIGPGKALDTTRYFVIVPNLFGNGLSSSPSNTPAPYDRARFPNVTILDNVTAQHQLITEHFGITRLPLVTGASMGAAQAYQWAVSYPDMVERLAPITGSSHTSPHNKVFLDGLRYALTADAAFADGDYLEPPRLGLRAFARVLAGWALSQAFYWERVYEKVGFATLDDFLTNLWEPIFATADANDLLAQIWTWKHADIGLTPGFDGDTEAALAAITAKTVALPALKDLYFPPEDEAWAVGHMRDAKLIVVPGIWGHLTGGGSDPEGAVFIDNALRELLTR